MFYVCAARFDMIGDLEKKNWILGAIIKA